MTGRAGDLPAARFSRAWRVAFPVLYGLLRLLDPLIRIAWRGFGLGNVVELRVAGRRTGTRRRVLLGLLRHGEHLFLGHPNGHVEWTRNLQAAGRGELVLAPPTSLPVRASLLPDGELRDAAILATSQHPFPGDLAYRLARAHVRAVGVFFEIEFDGARLP